MVLSVALTAVLSLLTLALAEQAPRKTLSAADLKKSVDREVLENCWRIQQLQSMLMQPGVKLALNTPVPGVGPDGKPCDQAAPLTTENLVKLGINEIIAGLRAKSFASEIAAGGCAPFNGRFFVDAIGGVTDPISLADLPLDMTTLRNKRVISLGEGENGLVPYFTMNNIDAYGIDIDQKYKTHSTPLLRAYQSRLLYGDATRLSAHPVSVGHFDHEVSATVACDLGYELAGRMVADGLKVLKMGGTSRHLFNTTETLRPRSPEYRAMLIHIREQARADGYDVRIYQLGIKTSPGDLVAGEAFPQELLVIKKVPLFVKATRK